MSLPRVEIEPATQADCRAVAEVQVESWQLAYQGLLPAPFLAALSVDEREHLWLRVLERQPSQLLVARSAGQVVGFVAFGASRDTDAPADRAEIRAIYVRPTSWSRGVGRHLWLAARQRLLDEGCRSISLWVAVGNRRALRFYARAGFVPDPASRRPLSLGGGRLEELRCVNDLQLARC